MAGGLPKLCEGNIRWINRVYGAKRPLVWSAGFSAVFSIVFMMVRIRWVFGSVIFWNLWLLVENLGLFLVIMFVLYVEDLCIVCRGSLNTKKILMEFGGFFDVLDLGCLYLCNF